jgi:hypothetical protein
MEDFLKSKTSLVSSTRFFITKLFSNEKLNANKNKKNWTKRQRVWIKFYLEKKEDKFLKSRITYTFSLNLKIKLFI